MKDVITVDEDVPLDLEVSRILMKDQTRPVLFSSSMACVQSVTYGPPGRGSPRPCR
jgi:hypothetical protein